MSNVLRFPDPAQRPPETTKGPQVEDGYTRIANELYEVVNNAHACPVNARHLRVIHAIIRRTYGFNKTMDALADTQLAADTGIPRNKVNVAKHELLAMKVLRLSDDGRKIGINKIYSEWDFTKRPEKKAPPAKTKTDQNGNGVTKTVTQEVTKTETHKRQKDSNTSPYGEESTAGADDPSLSSDEHQEPEPQAPEPNRLPNCPHQAILDKWAEVMPEKRQPLRSLWSKGAAGSRALAARWKQGFSILNESTGEPLYSDEATGIEWWGRFFRFLRRSEFLMRDDSRFFGLDWIVKAENFRKIMEFKYHPELTGGDQ